jgi:hypothetical protein
MHVRVPVCMSDSSVTRRPSAGFCGVCAERQQEFFGAGLAAYTMSGEVEAKKREELPVIFGAVTDKNIEQLRRLNSKIFPVKYDDKFYLDIRESGEFTKLGAWCLRHAVLACVTPARTACSCSVLFHRYIDRRYLLSFGTAAWLSKALFDDGRRPAAISASRRGYVP